jgi:nitroimidazol reductase NimA-like FMN-containing flavoprotein (pyridoxamine 5'-phosphate oxidase superfamily)
MSVNDLERQGLRPRSLTNQQRSELLELDQPAHLATIDASGFPHVTPIWFLWDGSAFVMTSLPDRPHVRRLRANPSASICIDIEEPERDDGERPNRQLRAVGTAIVEADAGGRRTARITRKYLHGPGAEGQTERRSSHDRVVIRLKPEQLIAVGSV